MSSEGREQLELAIAAQERLRGVVPDAIVDAGIAVLRQQLAAMRDGDQRRRLVSILFADVTGFTEMSARLDAEHVAEVMNELWSALDRVIADHGGRIDKHIGDAVMAMWGAAGAREDDPEQAVRAALAMQDELETRRVAYGAVVRMRVGVNTGPVLLGDVGTTSEFTAIGDAVNIASRLEHLAPVDGVLISHDTYRHVRGVFDVHGLGPISLRGRVEPVRVYAVERAKERAFRVASRGVEGVETNTVGRAAELARLSGEYERCCAEPGVRHVLVVGDAGVGKSRLLYEFRNWIELRRERVFMFSGRALLGRSGQALGLMRDVLATRFDIVLSDPPDVVVKKLRHGLAPVLGDDEAEIVGQWLGFELGASDSAQRLGGSAEFATVARAHLFAWFAALTEHEPGALLLEDLHWADDETLDLVAQLARRADMHLLVVGLTRTTLAERRPDWAPQATRIVLRALDEPACAELVGEILQHADAVPAALVDLIIERADGNPFYVEELIKMLIDDDVITAGAPGERWTIDTGSLDPSRVPATLTGVLQARLDSLPSTELTALQRAAVVGRVFWDQAVSALGEGAVELTSATLDDACRRELVHRRAPAAFAGCNEFIFKHALLRDVTYETVLHRERAQLHASAAAWLAAVAGQRVGEFREVVADHLEFAGDLSGAAAQLLEAGIAATKVGNLGAGLRTLSKAIDLWDSVGVGPDGRVFAPLVKVLRILGRLDAATALAERGLRDPSITQQQRARVLNESSVAASLHGDHDREWHELNLARALAGDDDLVLLSDIEIGIGWHHVALGRYDDAAVAANRGLQLALAVGDTAEASKAEAILAMTASARGDLPGCLHHAERELDHARRSGDLHALANAYGHLAVAHHLVGDSGDDEHYRTAMGLYESQIDLCRRLGADPAAAYSTVNLAQLHLRLGDGAQTHRLLATARALDPAPASSPTSMLLLQVEADRRVTRGDLAGGLSILGRLRELAGYVASEGLETERILSRVTATDEEVENLLAAGAGLDLDLALSALADEPDSPIPS